MFLYNLINNLLNYFTAQINKKKNINIWIMENIEFNANELYIKNVIATNKKMQYDIDDGLQMHHIISDKDKTMLENLKTMYMEIANTEHIYTPNCCVLKKNFVDISNENELTVKQKKEVSEDVGKDTITQIANFLKVETQTIERNNYTLYCTDANSMLTAINMFLKKNDCLYLSKFKKFTIRFSEYLENKAESKIVFQQTKFKYPGYAINKKASLESIVSNLNEKVVCENVQDFNKTKIYCIYITNDMRLCYDLINKQFKFEIENIEYYDENEISDIVDVVFKYLLPQTFITKDS
uniref:Uncharacterized protein n=1 Tax=Faxonius propinquus nudivirus TaxID=3139431 RepID=A0AAU8GBQ4_9VIRU